MNEMTLEEFKRRVDERYVTDCGGVGKMADWERSYMQSQEYAEKIERDYEEARKDGILSASSVVLDGRIRAVANCLSLMAE